MTLKDQGGDDTAGLQATDLADVVRLLAAARTPEDVQHIVGSAARRLVGADGATVVMREGAQCHYVDEDAVGPLWKGERFPMEACVSGWAMLHRRPAVIPDIALDDRIPREAYEQTFVRSLVMVPVGEDPIGAVGAYWGRPRKASRAEVEVLKALADTAALAMETVRLHAELERRVSERTDALQAVNARLIGEMAERRAAEEEVRRLSLTDDLTGLYNTRGFEAFAARALGAAILGERRATLLFMDVDGLKRVNDEQGHDAGSALLVGAARALEGAVRDGDVLGRLGGDEFGALIITDADETSPIAERVRAAMADAGIEMSVGAAAWAPGSTLPDLLRDADAAMYADKRERRGEEPQAAMAH